jgi:hypothetical protein
MACPNRLTGRPEHDTWLGSLVLGLVLGVVEAPAAEDTIGLAEAARTCGGMSSSLGAKVLTASGPLVAISKLKTGDKVEASQSDLADPVVTGPEG